MIPISILLLHYYTSEKKEVFVEIEKKKKTDLISVERDNSGLVGPQIGKKREKRATWREREKF